MKFMIVAFGVIVITLVLLQLIKHGGIETKSNKTAMVSGVCIGGAYLLTLKLSAVFNATVLFPTIAICGAVLTCLATKMLFKEHMTKIQLIAIVIGITSVVFIT